MRDSGINCKYNAERPAASVYTKHAATPDCCIYNRLQQFVYTTSRTFIILLFILSGCKSPQTAAEVETRDRSEVSAEEHETNTIDDTTTIRHTIINDTAFETKIIRKVINQRETLAQSLQDNQHQATEKKIDTLTPAIIKLLTKGIAVACIGIAVVIAGFFVILLAIIIKIKK